MGEIKQAFKTLMTLDSICGDKEEMKILIEAFARYVGTHYFVEEISQRTGKAEGLMNFLRNIWIIFNTSFEGFKNPASKIKYWHLLPYSFFDSV